MRQALLEHLVLPAAAALTPFKTARYVELMERSERTSLREQRSEQMALVRELLVHAHRETELTRRKLDGAGIHPVDVSDADAFLRVPITSKDELREGFPDRQVARSHRGAWLRYSNTSGTTGKPLMLVQDVTDISWKYASILRSRRLAGVPEMAHQVRLTPNECQPCLADGGSPTGSLGAVRRSSDPAALFLLLERQVMNPLFLRRRMLPPFWPGGGPVTPVDYRRVVRDLTRAAPEVLTIYPLYAMLLARFLRRTGVEAPRASMLLDFSAALCTPRMRAFLTETFGQRTAQGCGGCEFARYGASCEHDEDHLHLAEQYCYVEAVRADGRQCASGELGNLVVTSLRSRAMPIIRLEPGDVGRILESPCACGRLSRRIEHHGRIQALLRNADGRWVTDRACWDALLCLPGLALFQLRQRTERIYDLDLVLDPGAPLDRAALDAALAGLLGASAQVVERTVEGITPEASGKLQLVKSATFEEFRPAAARARRVPTN